MEHKNTGVLRYLFFIASFLLIPSFCIAQSYISAGGLRVGTDWGLSYKHRIADRHTLEGILQSSFKDRSHDFVLLGARHYSLITRGFNLYAGAGLHVGWFENQTELVRTKAGLTFIGGAEITLGKMNVSWDIKPAVNILGGYRILDMQSAVTLRYVFVKSNSKSKKPSLFNKKDSGGSTKRKRTKV